MIKDLEIIEGKIYSKQEDDLLDKRIEYLEVSIRDFKNELSKLVGKKAIKTSQVAEIARIAREAIVEPVIDEVLL